MVSTYRIMSVHFSNSVSDCVTRDRFVKIQLMITLSVDSFRKKSLCSKRKRRKVKRIVKREKRRDGELVKENC